MALEFTEPEQLEKFLADKPAQWSHIIAARAALRVLPIALTHLPEKHWLLIFRACFISWAVSKFPAPNMLAAAESIGSADLTAFPAVRSVAISAALYAARSASASTAVLASRYAVRAVTDSVAASIIRSATRDDSVQAVFRTPQPEGWAWTLATVDAAELMERIAPRSLTELMLLPLWGEVFPSLIVRRWEALAQNKAGSKYAPWIDWYQALLAGDGPSADYFSPDLTLRIAQQPDKWWDRPAEAVNADIAAWLAEGRNKQNDALINKVDEMQQQLIQRPAAASFGWTDGRLSADPPAPLPAGSLAQDFLDETRQKAMELRERLAMTNVPQHVRKSLDGVIAILPEQVSDLRPGVLRSRARSLHATAAAYAGQFKDGELAVDAVAMVFDLSGGLRDLEGCFPELRDIEKEIAALNLKPKDVAAVQQHLEAINGVVSESPVVADSAKTVMAVGTETMKADAPAEIVEVRTAEQALVARNLVNVALQGSIQQILSRVPGTVGRVYDETEKTVLHLIRPVGTVGASYLIGSLVNPVAGLATFALAEYEKLPGIISFIKEARKMLGLGDADSE